MATSAVGLNPEEICGLKPFDPIGDPTNMGTRWQRWLKSFNWYANSRGLLIDPTKENKMVQRRALLIHVAGEEVQKIFETLPDTGEAKEYQKAEDALNAYFNLQVNATFQNHLFRNMEQKDGEMVAQFVMRLRHAVKDCDYGNQADNQSRSSVQVNRPTEKNFWRKEGASRYKAH